MSLGQLFVISAPSGAGKTSLVNAALADISNLAVSISHTTRIPRAGEIDGRDYHFVDHVTFKTLVDQNAMFEHAEVFGNFYGTSKQSVIAQIDKGIDVVLEIDWQGATQVRNLWPDAISIFILPPTREALRNRLIDRNQDEDKVISVRMAEADRTIDQAPNFDYWIINDDFEIALGELKSIFFAQRQKQVYVKTKYPQLLEKLLGHT